MQPPPQGPPPEGPGSPQGFGPPQGLGQPPGFGAPPPHGAALPKSRKDQILIFTILGWAVCGVFSFVGYQMATTDMSQMAMGEMEI
ncbi:MAG: hypothetical protein AAGF12_07305 [Myxococcota bacterium]